MELPITRPLNSSSSETSIDSGFETPATKGGNISPLNHTLISQGGMAVSTTAVTLSNMLVSVSSGSGLVTNEQAIGHPLILGYNVRGR